MGDFNARVSATTFQYCDGTNTVLVGPEVRYNYPRGYVGLGVAAATDNQKDLYGLLDVKAKCNYDNKGVFDQNLRIRTAIDGDGAKSTQVRYSPFTVNIPISDEMSIYTNIHYSGKYSYETNNWKHSIGNFTGVSWDVTPKDNLSLEGQRYNLQDLSDNSGGNWSINLSYTHKF